MDLTANCGMSSFKQRYKQKVFTRYKEEEEWVVLQQLIYVMAKKGGGGQKLAVKQRKKDKELRLSK